MTNRSKYLQRKKTPGGTITTRAFDYSCSFYDFAAPKFPELKQYPPEKTKGTALQAAIIVSTLIQMERLSGGAGWSELHAGVARSFASSVQHKNMSAIQDLACALLESNRGALKADEIPSFAGLAASGDDKLTNMIGVWLTLSLSQKPQLEQSDMRLAAAIGKNAWASAKMIVRARTQA
jgi:hypothetical protein